MPKHKRTGWIQNVMGFIRLQVIFEHLPFVFFITLILMLYIANGHRSDRMIRKINKTHLRVKELKSEFISSKSQLIKLTKESELLSRLRPSGLVPLTEMPLIIEDTAQLENKYHEN